MEWRLRCVVTAAAVTTHAKPHAQQLSWRWSYENLFYIPDRVIFGYPYSSTIMEWRLRRVVPAAAVTTHAKPHAQQQLARDLEVELRQPFLHSGQGDIWVPV